MSVHYNEFAVIIISLRFNLVKLFAGEAGTDDTLLLHAKCTCNCRVHTETCAITQRARRASTWQNRQKVLDSQEDKVRNKEGEKKGVCIFGSKDICAAQSIGYLVICVSL